MNVVQLDEAHRYVLVPVEAPTSKAEAEAIEKSVWNISLGRGGQRPVVVHGDEHVGDVVSWCSWPYDHEVTLRSAAADVRKGARMTLPAGTAYLGIQFTPEG